MKSFLNLIKSYFLGTIQDKEKINRFITSSKDFTQSTNSIKYNTFLPFKPTKQNMYELSVNRISKLNEKQIWNISNLLTKPPKARAVLIVSSFKQLNLKLKSTPRTHFTHVDVVHWPEKKEERMVLAKKLAASSELFMPPVN